jgi:hypothetical protein
MTMLRTLFRRQTERAKIKGVNTPVAPALPTYPPRERAKRKVALLKGELVAVNDEPYIVEITRYLYIEQLHEELEIAERELSRIEQAYLEKER